MDHDNGTDYTRLISGETPEETARNAEAAINDLNHREVIWSFALIVPGLITLLVADHKPKWTQLRIRLFDYETEEGRRQIAQILACTGSFGTLEQIEAKLATSQLHYISRHRC